MAEEAVDVAIIGAGIAGIATAYYLTEARPAARIVLIDSRQPMSYTSAQSGDNYRNWWPHETMAAFTNDSIDELDRLVAESDNFFQMTRGGYALATRHSDVSAALGGISDIDVDVVSGADIPRRFPMLSADIANVVHIRRGGDISGQQLGTWMLDRARARGCRRINGEVVGIDPGYQLTIASSGGSSSVRAAQLVVAAGPFVNRLTGMLDVELPVSNVYQQKIAFEDTRGAIPRDMPFSIDLDEKTLNWSDEERQLLADEPALRWLTEPIHGGTHCRPEGGANGRWVKLGWAYNHSTSEPQEDLANEPRIDPQFPEIVIRGAAAFLPSMHQYIEQPPTRFTHYGGYYTMTEENWPLIGPLNDEGVFVIGALSGFGSMAACAAGKLCAAHVVNKDLPNYAAELSLQRYENESLMQQLRSADKGLL